MRVPLDDVEKNQPATTCLVTGGGSYVGSAVVERLLQSGHKVHATARRRKKLDALKSLPNSENLRVFEADLLVPGSFDEAIQDCTHVFHVASPFWNNVKPSEAEDRLYKPAVNGVENVLAACSSPMGAKVKRVVLTSSTAAVQGRPWEKGKDHVTTEADWNMSSTKDFQCYSYSKLMAEKKAWEIEKGQKAWSMVSINPGFVLGPPVFLPDGGDGESLKVGKDAAAGKYKFGCPNLGMFVVDVDDVAKAHCVAAFKSEAKGRYILAAKGDDLHNVMKSAEKEFLPEQRKIVGTSLPRWSLWIACNVFKLYPWETVEPLLHKVPKVDNSKAREELGIDFIQPGRALGDMIKRIDTLLGDGKK